MMLQPGSALFWEHSGACWLRALVLSTAVVVLQVVADDASHPSFLFERRGQDNFVRRASDGEIVYTTSVDDTSEGSDTDEDLQGDEEFFHGCLWSFRQKLGICEGGNCGDAEIMAHDLQRKLVDFYADRRLAAAPPLEEAAWFVHGMRPEDRQELVGSCAGLVVSLLFFTAEALTFAGSPQAEALALEAQSYAGSLQVQSPLLFETMLDMFPVAAAYQGYQVAAEALRRSSTVAAPSVDVVISRCKSKLQWLWELEYPQRTRLFVYDKCRNDPAEFEEQTAGLRGMLEAIELVPLQEMPGSELMTAECTVYLTHIIAAQRARNLADFTIFSHDDGPRHIRLSLLSLALQGMRSGMYDVGFLHLSHERYPSFRTRCLRDVYRRIFGEELEGTVSTYCCAHFVVQRSRIEARPVEFYEHAMHLVETAAFDREHEGPCNVGRKPCYVMEFLWHRFFGEPDELAPRALDRSLPLALRYEGGRETRLPSPLEVAPYMSMFRPSRYSRELLRSR